MCDLIVLNDSRSSVVKVNRGTVKSVTCEDAFSGLTTLMERQKELRGSLGLGGANSAHKTFLMV